MTNDTLWLPTNKSGFMKRYFWFNFFSAVTVVEDHNSENCRILSPLKFDSKDWKWNLLFIINTVCFWNISKLCYFSVSNLSTWSNCEHRIRCYVCNSIKEPCPNFKVIDLKLGNCAWCWLSYLAGDINTVFAALSRLVIFVINNFHRMVSNHGVDSGNYAPTFVSTWPY